jgi:hypothetical protein
MKRGSIAPIHCAAMNPDGNAWTRCPRNAHGRHNLCQVHEDALYGAILGLVADKPGHQLLNELRVEEAFLRNLAAAIAKGPLPPPSPEPERTPPHG